MNFSSYETPRDSCLSLRWDTAPYWRELVSELGVKHRGAPTALAIGLCDEVQSYSRHKPHFTERNKFRRYRNPIYTHANVVKTIDQLHAQGLVENWISSPQHRGTQSTCKPTQEFASAMREIVAKGAPLLPTAPRETIWLRDANGNLVDYRDNRPRDRMRSNLQIINERIKGAVISGYASGAMVRIFNENFDRGGRFYGLGQSWQNMPKAERRLITIDGESVVEIDYRALHPSMLYAMANLAHPEDMYKLGNYPRELVKLGVLIAINASSLRGAARALSNKAEMGCIGVNPNSYEARVVAEDIVCGIVQVHHGISEYFGRDMGAKLMQMDGDIAETVMLEMASLGITVLPVHDSFLVPASKSELLQNFMERASYDFVGRSISTSVVGWFGEAQNFL